MDMCKEKTNYSSELHAKSGCQHSGIKKGAAFVEIIMTTFWVIAVLQKK
jgi:hypothetical protein